MTLTLQLQAKYKICSSVTTDLDDVGRLGHGDHQLLELGVDVVEALRVDRKLLPDVLGPDEDRLQVGPGPLDVEPETDHLKTETTATEPT